VPGIMHPAGKDTGPRG